MAYIHTLYKIFNELMKISRVKWGAVAGEAFKFISKEL